MITRSVVFWSLSFPLVVACGGSSDDATSGASGGSSQAGSAGAAQAGAGQGGAAQGGAAGQASGGTAGKATAGGSSTGGGAGAAGSPSGGSGGSSSAGGPSAGTAGVAGNASGGTSSMAGSGGAPAGGSGPFTSVVAPPPDPTAPMAMGTATIVLAVKTWTVTTPYIAYSDNLDGAHFTDANDTKHCQPRAGAKKKDVVLDGPNGEDNSFARNITPIFEGLSGSFAADLDAGIAAGEGTFVVRVRNLGPAASYNGLSVDGLGALGDVNNPPVAFGSYAWRPLANQLSASAGTGDALVATSPSKLAYTSGNVLVAQKIKDTTLPLVTFAGGALMLPLHDARIIAALSTDHQAITSGRLAGVIPAIALSDAFRALAAKISSSLCSGGALTGVVQQLEGAADMMVNGTQDPSAVCDGVSFGIGLQGLASGVGASVPLDLSSSCP